MIPYSFYIISFATCNRVNKFYKLRNVGLYDLTVSLKKKNKSHFQEAILLLFNVHIFNQAIIAGAFYTYHRSSSLLIL